MTTTWSQSVGIVEGGSYYFKVSAHNEIDAGSQSSASEKIIAATVPAQPSAPLMSSQSETAITITWSAPLSGGDPIQGYKIQ